MLKKNILLSLLLISLIYCNKTQNETNNTADTNNTKKVIDSSESFNMTIDEMDTMIFCAVIMEERVKKYSSKILELQKKLNVTTIELVSNKISADIFQNCTRLITKEKVNYYIKNLTFINQFAWEKNFDKISEINFEKYTNSTDLDYAINQQVLMYKFQKVEEIFKQKQIEDRDRYIKANQKIKIGNYDLEKIPKEIKIVIFLIIFSIFFGTIFYYLKGLNKKIGSNQKKKKKKIK